VQSEEILDENKDLKESSIILLSNYTKFNYNDSKNLVVFGDSHSAVGTNYTDMSYSYWNHSGGKNWPMYMEEFNKNLKLWNYAKGGSLIDEKLVIIPKYYKIDLKKQYEYFIIICQKIKDFIIHGIKTILYLLFGLATLIIINCIKKKKKKKK